MLTDSWKSVRTGGGRTHMPEKTKHKLADLSGFPGSNTLLLEAFCFLVKCIGHFWEMMQRPRQIASNATPKNRQPLW